MSSVLVLFAHPAIHKSRVNGMMAAAAREVAGVTFHDLYEAYPDFVIDARREQELLVRHDAVVLQHPLFWYSAPSIFKEWIDLVLQEGFAYGSGGRLAGKTWMHAVTTAGPDVTFEGDGYAAGTLPWILAPFAKTAAACGMAYREPFVACDKFRLLSAKDVPKIAERYKQVLASL